MGTSGVGEGCLQGGHHGDAIGATIEDLTSVLTGVAVVDHRAYAVASGVAYQAVGGLAVGRAEGPLAVNDGVTLGECASGVFYLRQSRVGVHPRLPVRMAT